jgi:anti-sigma factor RsiW
MKLDPDLALRLSAFRDGELPEDEALAVERLITEDPEIAAEYEALVGADAAISSAFAAMLHAPIPAALARSIDQAPTMPPAANAPAAPRWGIGIAAAMGFLLIGGVGGAVLTRALSGPTESIAAASGWLDQVAEYHAIYAGQTRHLVEVPAWDKDHLETWLSETTKVSFRVPDLSASGLTFQGARLLAANGKPVAQLMYTDVAGRVVAVCFVQGGDPAVAEGQTAFADHTFGELDMISWKSRDASYVVVGPRGDKDLGAIAQTAAIAL